MSNAHTQSFTRQISAGSVASNYRAIGPVIFSTDSLSAAGVFGVKGSITRNGQVLDLDQRWLTLTTDEVRNILDQGMKDETIQSIRVVSQVAGSRYAAGSEDALLVSLTSKEGSKLAEKYGFAYERTVSVGQAQIQVTHKNAVAITLAAANQALGLLQYPGIEKETRPSRADQSNPTVQAALDFYDATGALPTRVKVANSRIDEDFAANFTAAPAGRTYNNNDL
jgi:hypothetical protein